MTMAVAALLSLAILGAARAGDGEATDATCSWDKGFHLQRSEGPQKLKIYGYMQALWTGEFGDGELDANEFQVRRARLLASGSVLKTLGFKLHVDFATAKPLLDYYVDYKPWQALGIRAGQYKTPLGRQFLDSAAKKQFIDDTIATAEFKLDRDIGLMLHGAVSDGLLGYQVGVFNGSGKNARQDNTDLMYVARLELAPFGPVPYSESDIAGSSSPLLSIALASGYNTVDVTRESDEVTQAARYTVGGEVALFWRGLYAATEVFWRVVDPSTAGASVNSLGGYFQTGYMVIPRHLELGARGALVRGDMDESGDDRWEAGPVVNAFFLGHRLKLQLDYAALVDEDPLGEDALDHRIRVQLHAAF